MSIYFRQIQHLLPRTKTWSLPFGSTIRKFFEGIADGLSEPARDFIDGVWAEMFPETTNELVEWEQELGCWGSGTEAQRRLSLAAEWQATGGQSPRYLQDTLQAAGFDVYYHGWWDPVLEEVRDPHDYTESAHSGTEQCWGTADYIQDQCADVDTDDPPRCDFFLANEIHYIVNESLNRMAPPPLPDDEDLYRSFIYFGAEEFGNYAYVPEDRLIELKRLMLKISPANPWIVTLVHTIEPAQFGNCVAWWACHDPAQTSYADSSSEQILNGGWEDSASPPTPDNWSPGNNATLTRESGTPYAGSYCGRVAYNGTSNPYGGQTVLVTGATYYATGMQRSSGGSIKGRLHVATPYVDGTPGISDWEQLRRVAKADYNLFYAQAVTTGAGYVEWDACSCVECPGSSLITNLASPGTGDLVQAPQAYMGTLAPEWGGAGGLDCLRTDGSDDWHTADEMAAYFSGTDTAFTIGMSLDLTNTTSGRYVFSAGNSGSNTQYITLQYASGNLYVQKHDDATGSKQVTLSSVSAARHTIVIRCSGTLLSALVDGVAKATDQDFDVGVTTLDQFTWAALRRVAVAGYADQAARDVTLFDEDIGATNALALSAWHTSRSPTS